MNPGPIEAPAGPPEAAQESLSQQVVENTMLNGEPIRLDGAQRMASRQPANSTSCPRAVASL